MTPSLDRKTRKLLTQIACLEGVLNGSFNGMCAEKLKADLFSTAREIRDEWDKPLAITPWSPDRGAGV